MEPKEHECDKRKSHISRKLRMICLCSNNVRHHVTKNFTALHSTTLHSTSLHMSTLHFLTFKLHPTTINPSAWGHLNPSSYCDVGSLFYEVFNLWSKLQRKK